MSISDPSSIAPYLKTTEVYPEDESQLRVTQTNIYTSIATAVNVREIAIYDLQQLITGQQFFTPGDPQQYRYTYRKVFNLGAIAPGATLTVAHNLTNITIFTRMYGTCLTSAPDYRPIPYSSVTALNQQIELRADATNLYVSNGAGSPAITSAIVVLEYILG
jgi:hypothetical protein